MVVKRLLQEVITEEMLPLFVIRPKDQPIQEISDYPMFLSHVVAHEDTFKRVTFRYYEDVFIGSSNTKGSIWDALSIMSKIFNYDWLTEDNPRSPATAEAPAARSGRWRLPSTPSCRKW